MNEPVMENTPTTEPQDRLTRIADAMGDTFKWNPEYEENDRCIVFMTDQERSGLGIFGYEGEDGEEAIIEAMTDLFMHLRAMYRATGRDLQFIGIPDDVSGLEP